MDLVFLVGVAVHAPVTRPGHGIGTDGWTSFKTGTDSQDEHGLTCAAGKLPTFRDVPAQHDSHCSRCAFQFGLCTQHPATCIAERGRSMRGCNVAFGIVLTGSRVRMLPGLACCTSWDRLTRMETCAVPTCPAGQCYDPDNTRCSKGGADLELKCGAVVAPYACATGGQFKGPQSQRCCSSRTITYNSDDVFEYLGVGFCRDSNWRKPLCYANSPEKRHGDAPLQGQTSAQCRALCTDLKHCAAYHFMLARHDQGGGVHGDCWVCGSGLENNDVKGGTWYLVSAGDPWHNNIITGVQGSDGTCYSKVAGVPGTATLPSTTTKDAAAASTTKATTTTSNYAFVGKGGCRDVAGKWPSNFGKTGTGTRSWCEAACDLYAACAAYSYWKWTDGSDTGRCGLYGNGLSTATMVQQGWSEPSGTGGSDAIRSVADPEGHDVVCYRRTGRPT